MLLDGGEGDSRPGVKLALEFLGEMRVVIVETDVVVKVLYQSCLLCLLQYRLSLKYFGKNAILEHPKGKTLTILLHFLLNLHQFFQKSPFFFDTTTAGLPVFFSKLSVVLAEPLPAEDDVMQQIAMFFG